MTGRRKTRRQDPENRQKEQSHNTNRRKACRQDMTYKRQESAWRREHGRSTTAQLVSYFHQLISSGPVYICTACDQLFYKHNVKKVSSIRSLALPVLDTVLLGKISSNGNEYVCHTYAKYSHTHTHTRLMALCPGLPGWASTRKVKPIWILVKQETVSGSGQHLTAQFFTGRMPFLPPNQRWRQITHSLTHIKTTTTAVNSCRQLATVSMFTFGTPLVR